MPTYDYKCKACDHIWEEFQSITAQATKKCPECGKLKAERMIGPGAGLLFKGSGFYITDYRSEGYKKAAKADSSSGDSPKSESKGGESKSGESKKANSRGEKSSAKDSK